MTRDLPVSARAVLVRTDVSVVASVPSLEPSFVTKARRPSALGALQCGAFPARTAPAGALVAVLRMPSSPDLWTAASAHRPSAGPAAVRLRIATHAPNALSAPTTNTTRFNIWNLPNIWVRSLLLTSRLEIRSRARERSDLRHLGRTYSKIARSAPLLGVIRQRATYRQPQRSPASSIQSKPPLAATVQYVAPASVVVTARLSAPGEVRGRGHHFVGAAI